MNSIKSKLKEGKEEKSAKQITILIIALTALDSRLSTLHLESLPSPGPALSVNGFDRSTEPQNCQKGSANLLGKEGQTENRVPWVILFGGNDLRLGEETEESEPRTNQ